jgi:molybdopterin-synthase adenylyltransferase
MMFSVQETERYCRQLVLREIGGPGQQALQRTKILVIGAGGLGCVLLPYLAGAGIGHITIVDDDTVSLSNLHRQILFSEADIGRNKAEVAASFLTARNPHIVVNPVPIRLDEQNGEALISACDIVVDGSDNFETRYRVADFCEALHKPLVSGSLGRMDGAVTTLVPHEEDVEGRPNPNLRCLFPEPPPQESVPTCSEIGIPGPLAGMIGTVMAMEVLKRAASFGAPLVGRLLLVDALDMRFRTLSYRRISVPAP